jgi:ubiquinone biosynthesis protein
VLIGHGWDCLRQGGDAGRTFLNRHSGSLTRPEHLRCALEELGIAFITLGQILSTRADLLPPDYLAELTKLQDSAPHVPLEAVRDTIVAQLGQPLESLFLHFDPKPLAAASIGQAHGYTTGRD